MSEKKKKENFEELCSRLEEIVGSLEEENLPLEKSIELFSEGVEVASRARALLEKGEKTVQKLVEKMGGTFELEDFEETPGNFAVQ